MIGYGGYEAYFGTLSSKWPTTQAYVEQASVDHVRGKNGQLQDKLSLKYNYSVNGKKYSCDRIKFGWAMSPPHGSHTLEKFKDSTVEISYNPEQPDMACFIPGVELGTIGLICAAGVLCMFSRHSRNRTTTV